MRVWRLEVELGYYETFGLVDEESPLGVELENDLSRGKTHNGKYDNVEIEVLENGLQSDLPKIWSLPCKFICSEKTRRCLEELLKDSVEFIPLRCTAGQYYIINILNILDAIDYERATFMKLKRGAIIGMEKCAFIEKRIEGFNIFRVLLNGKIDSTETYVTDEFKQVVEDNELEGFKFEPVWEN